MNPRLLKNASPLAALPGAPACFSEGVVVSQFHLEKYLPPGNSFVLNQLLFWEANTHTLFESNRKKTLKGVALAVGSCSFPSVSDLWSPCHPLGLEVKTRAALPGALATSADNFDCDHLGKGCYPFWWVEARDAAERPTMPGTAPHNNVSGPSVSSGG